MDPYFSKNKSSPFTLDTQNQNSSTFGKSLLEKEFNEGSHTNLVYPSERFSIDEDEPNPFANRFKVDARHRYIFKILGSQEHQSLPSIKHQHVFIYDWDDTLLFTSYLKGKNFTELSEESKKMLKQLDQVVCEILNYSINKGYVFMITNSIKGWINYSSKLYMPKTHELIMSSEKIKIWSARELYQQTFPTDIRMWKFHTYRKLKDHLRTNIVTNVICIGDREDDMDACQVLVEDFEKIYIKKIKFQQKPHPEQLIKELRLLQKKFQHIFHAIANTTIKLAKRVLSPDTQRRRTTMRIPQFNALKK